MPGNDSNQASEFFARVTGADQLHGPNNCVIDVLRQEVALYKDAEQTKASRERRVDSANTWSGPASGADTEKRNENAPSIMAHCNCVHASPASGNLGELVLSHVSSSRLNLDNAPVYATSCTDLFRRF